MIVILLLFSVSLLLYLYFRKSRAFIYNASKSLHSVGELPLIGHMHWFIGGSEEILNNVCSLIQEIEKSEKVCKIWVGPTLYMVTMNLDDIQLILENSVEKDSAYRFLKPWLGNGLLLAPLEPWKAQRRQLLPIFTNRQIEDYIEAFGRHADVLVQLLEKEVGQGSFDAYEYISPCLLDIVLETAMGEQLNVQRDTNSPYLKARITIMSIIHLRMFKVWLQSDALFNLTKHAKIQRQNIEYSHKFVDEVIRRKKAAFEKQRLANDNEKEEGRKDILQLLLEGYPELSDVQLREHIDSIVTAGNDSTALIVAYALVVLGQRQDLQDKVYQELRTIFGDSKRCASRDDLSRMEYMDRFIKETMRMYSTVPIMGRTIRKETKLSTCTVPAGIGCAVVPKVIHTSKRVWGPDADVFNPDRFLPENSYSRHPCAFLPFGFGPRNCIGRYFGMLSIKSILANVLRSYKISSKGCDRFKIQILMFPVEGHQISIEKRT